MGWAISEYAVTTAAGLEPPPHPPVRAGLQVFGDLVVHGLVRVSGQLAARSARASARSANHGGAR